MQRLRVEGTPEAVLASVQERLRELGATPRLVDPASITLLFDIDVTDRGPAHTFFVAVVPTDAGHCDLALARKRNRRREDYRAMFVGEDDPIEIEVLHRLTEDRKRDRQRT